VLLHADKAYLQECLAKIKEFLQEKCGGLWLNEKTQIFHIKQGVKFLGWHFYQTESGQVVRLLKKDCKKKRRAKNKMHLKRYLLEDKKWLATFTDVDDEPPDLSQYKVKLKMQKIAYQEWKQSLGSWFGHAEHGDSFHFRVKLAGEIRAMCKGKMPYNHVEGLVAMLFRSGHKKKKKRRVKFGVCRISRVLAEREVKKESDWPSPFR
jgi:hypothetical protein